MGEEYDGHPRMRDRSRGLEEPMSNDAGTAMAGDHKRHVDIALVLYTFTHKVMALEALREGEAAAWANRLEKIVVVLRERPDMVEALADEKDQAKEMGLEGYSLDDDLPDYEKLQELGLKLIGAMEEVAEDRKKLLGFPEGQALVQFIESRKDLKPADPEKGA